MSEITTDKVKYMKNRVEGNKKHSELTEKFDNVVM